MEHLVWIWLILLIAFAGVEALTAGLTSVWFALGAAAATIVAAFDGGFWPQLWVFLGVSGLSMLALRPVVKRYLNPRHEPTNADRLIGEKAVVTEEIDNLNARGAVRVSGVEWTARSADDAAIPAGEVVLVERIEGAKLLVRAAAPCAASQ